MFNIDYNKINNSAVREVVFSITEEEKIVRHIITYRWVSGSVTEVSPITFNLNDVEVYVDTDKESVLKGSIEKVLEKNADFFSKGYFVKSDGSCPSCIRFVYTEELKKLLIKNK